MKNLLIALSLLATSATVVADNNHSSGYKRGYGNYGTDTNSYGNGSAVGSFSFSMGFNGKSNMFQKQNYNQACNTSKHFDNASNGSGNFMFAMDFDGKTNMDNQASSHYGYYQK